MAYYFQCNECNKKEFFNYKNQTDLPYLNPPKYYNIKTPEGKKQKYETVICSTCINKKVRLKGNYIII